MELKKKKGIYVFDSWDNLWVTSDTHFDHENIIRFCKRPFSDVKEMNETLIKNWNDRVKPDDIVFHLGDFSWGSSQSMEMILQRLNGHIVLIRGNHDKPNYLEKLSKYFLHIDYQMDIEVAGRKICLNHYPFLCYAGTYHNTNDKVWQLFGHVHSGPNNSGLDCDRLAHLFPTQYDVGVDNNDFAPVAMSEVKAIIEEQIESNGLSRKPNGISNKSYGSTIVKRIIRKTKKLFGKLTKK